VKHFLLIFLTFFTFAPLYGQLWVGAKSGGTFVRRQQMEGSGSGWSSSYHAGVAVNVYLAEFSFGGFAVQPEALYNRKGGDGLQLGYVEVPLNIIYQLNFGNVIPYVFVAPYYAFLVNEMGAKATDGAISYAKSDYGVKLGGGVELWYFQLSAAYVRGLGNVVKSDALASRNAGAEISLGYFFLR
jgi:hypothetical protein